MTRSLLASLVAAALVVAPAAAQQPAITAPSAIVVEAVTGDVVYERNPDERRPIASTTKLMTALLTLEQKKLSDVVTASRYRAQFAAETRLGLRPGERMTIADLLRGLLLVSANDAAATLAERVSGSREAFVRDMNRRARELGMTNTRFANPIGLDDPNNFSTATDLATLTRELRKHTFFTRTVDRPSLTLESGVRPRTVTNRNRLLAREPWVDGVKTGHTLGAGYVLVGSGRLRGVSLISVVLGTASESARENETLTLLRYGSTRFRRVTAVQRGKVLASVPIEYRAGAKLPLIASRTVRRVLPVTKAKLRLGTPKDIPAQVTGPIRKGQRFGVAPDHARVVVFHGDELVTTVALVAASDIPEAGFGRRANDFLTRPGTIGLLALVILAIGLASAVRRRIASRESPRREVRAA